MFLHCVKYLEDGWAFWEIVKQRLHNIDFHIITDIIKCLYFLSGCLLSIFSELVNFSEFHKTRKNSGGQEIVENDVYIPGMGLSWTCVG